jgi:aryl-alcohol dehydrogenase-like predicted oxidoreductase
VLGRQGLLHAATEPRLGPGRLVLFALDGGGDSVDETGVGPAVRAHFAKHFQGDNLRKNLELVDRVKRLADQRGVKPGQVAPAWVLAQGADVVPIPGTKRRTYLQENIDAVDVKLSEDELQTLDEAARKGRHRRGPLPGHDHGTQVIAGDRGARSGPR